jgi:hypothetical protein
MFGLTQDKAPFQKTDGKISPDRTHKRSIRCGAVLDRFGKGGVEILEMIWRGEARQVDLESIEQITSGVF